jgi:magnesium-transporting ATPase (P-type)
MSLSAETTRSADRKRSVAANILVSVAVLALLLIAVVDLYLSTQWNFVTKMIMVAVALVVGWIPVALTMIAVSLRPYWVTFLALGLVGAAILGSLIVFFFV